MRLRLLVIAGAAVLLFGGLWFVRRPVVTAVKEWRAASLVTQAEEAAAEKLGREAVQLATAATQLEPKRLDTLRRLMRHGRVVGMPELPAVTLLVFFHDDHTLEDRREILEWAIGRGDVAFFDQLYPNLEDTEAADPATRLLHARKLGVQGRILDAVEVVRDLEGDQELGDEVSLFLATMLSRLTENPAARQQARERIHALLQHPDEKISLQAWRSLAMLPVAQRDPGPDFSPQAWLEARPSAKGDDFVIAGRIEVERLPEAERIPAMEKAARELVGREGAVSSVVRWYLEAGAGAKLLELPEEPFLAEVSVYSSRLQVYLDLGRFDEAEAWLDKAPEGFPESVSGSLAAVFARRAGRDSEALSAWRRVIDRAASLQNYGDCLSVLKIAEKFGEEEAAKDVVAAIVSFPPNRLPPSEMIEFLEPRFASHEKEWLEFWRGIARARGGDAFAMDQVAFLELGVDGEVDSAGHLERTAQIVRRFPGAPRFRATHALWLMQVGRNEEALALLREADLNWNEADSMARATYALALDRTGSKAEAAALKSGLRWTGIGPVRRATMEKILGAVPGSANS
jgi:tetratricopeptide (TPR) repeat protein